MSDDIEERMRTLAVKPLCPYCGKVATSSGKAGPITLIGCECIPVGAMYMFRAPDALEQAMRDQFARSQDASNAAVFPLDEGRPPTPVQRARTRLEAAALAIGDCHLAGIDPGWAESNEVEQAAILYTRAVRAEQEGK